jgi:hypothetical protein
MSTGVGGGYSNEQNVNRYRYVGEVPGQPGQPGYSPLQELMKAAWSRMTGAMGGRDWFKTGWAPPNGRAGGGYRPPTTPPPPTGGQGAGGTNAQAPPTEERRYTPGQTPSTPAPQPQPPRSAPAPGFGEEPVTPAQPGGGGTTRPPSGSAVPEPGEQPSPPGYTPPRTGRPPDERNPQSSATAAPRRENAGGEWDPLRQGQGGQQAAAPGFGENATDWGRTRDGKPPSEKDGAAEGDSWKSPDGKVYVYKGGTWTAHDGSTWGGSSGPPVGGGSGGDNGNGGNTGGGGEVGGPETKPPDNPDPDAPPVDPGSGYYYPWDGVPPEWNGPGTGGGFGNEGEAPGGLVGYYLNELGSQGYDPEVANALRNSTMGAVGNQANAARRDMARRVAATGNDAGYFGAAADVAGTAAAQTEEAARQNVLANEQERARRNAIGLGGMQTLSDQEREDEQAWARLFAGLATKPREVEGEQSGTNINVGFGF